MKLNIQDFVTIGGFKDKKEFEEHLIKYDTNAIDLLIEGHDAYLVFLSVGQHYKENVGGKRTFETLDNETYEKVQALIENKMGFYKNIDEEVFIYLESIGQQLKVFNRS